MFTNYSIPSEPKVILIQRGARRRYSVPRILENSSMLHQVVTDAHSTSRLGKFARTLTPIPFHPSSVKRLAARQLTTSVPDSKVTAIDSWLWHDWRLRSLKSKNLNDWFDQRDRVWTNLVLPHLRFKGANILYSMGDENLRLIREAQSHGLKVLVDAFISPYSIRTTYEEKRRLGIQPSLEEIQHQATETHYREVYSAADMILSPSTWVTDAIRQLDPILEKKIIQLPYGTSIQGCPVQRNPQPRRIFWAGADWLRKGLHHLAAAADLLRLESTSYDIRAAGITDREVLSDSRFRNINFLGKLNRQQMHHEFMAADLFVFPTLSEGMAGVVIEALAAGCPVIVPPSAGVDAVENHVSGIVINSYNPEKLSDIIESLCNDRNRLLRMGSSAASLAEEFSESAWAVRLQTAMRTVHAIAAKQSAIP